MRKSKIVGLRALVWIWGAVLLSAGNVLAFDSVTLSYGSSWGNHDEVDVYRLGLQRSWKQRWYTDGKWYLSGQWELLAGQWQSDPGNTGTDELQEVGARANTRLYRYPTGEARFQPYFELGLGIHLLSSSQIEDKDLSTNYQFGSNVGAGVRFGRGHQFEIGWRFMHLSNADIEKPNPGINFNLVHLGYRF